MFKLAATSLAGTALALGDFANIIKATRGPISKKDLAYGYETLSYNRHYSPSAQRTRISAPFYSSKKTATKQLSVRKPYAARSSRSLSKDKKVVAKVPVLAKPYSLGSRKSDDYVYFCRSKSC